MQLRVSYFEQAGNLVYMVMYIYESCFLSYFQLVLDHYLVEPSSAIKILFLGYKVD